MGLDFSQKSSKPVLNFGYCQLIFFQLASMVRIPFSLVHLKILFLLPFLIFLFNSDYSAGPGVNTHTCGEAEGASDVDVNTNWNMFSRQLLNDDNGITVSDGDSLSVKWTITVG